jgi:D-threo-aldose 1-dehydrogenase
MVPKPVTRRQEDQMQRNQLGQTDLHVTAVGFGTSPLGSMPETYGYTVDEQRADATLQAMLDSPVNVIDTSRNYGSGRSEERLGAAIASRGGLPAQVVVSTKLDRDMDSCRFDAAQARRSIEESLEALGLDEVQLLHLHDPEYGRDLDEITRPGGALDELFKIRDEGLAAAVGLAMGRIDVMFPLIREHHFDVILNHNRYTLLNRRADEMFEYAHRQGMAIMNAAPYAGGVLAKGSDQVQRVTYQDADDKALAPIRAIERICAEFDVPLGAAALQFSTRDPRIATTIVGVSKPERVVQTVEWAEHPIPDELWQAVGELPVDRTDPEANREYNPG